MHVYLWPWGWVGRMGIEEAVYEQDEIAATVATVIGVLGDGGRGRGISLGHQSRGLVNGSKGEGVSKVPARSPSMLPCLTARARGGRQRSLCATGTQQ